MVLRVLPIYSDISVTLQPSHAGSRINNEYLDSFANRSLSGNLIVNGQLELNEDGTPIRMSIYSISKDTSGN